MRKGKTDSYKSIMEMVYRKGPITRNEIARELGITIPSVTTTIKPLLDKGILKEVPCFQKEGTLGRKASAIDVAEKAGYAVGIEWSPIGLSACITDLRGSIVEKLKKEFPEREVYNDYQSMLDETKKAVEELLSISGILEENVIGAGWSTPGMIDPEKGILVRSSMTKCDWKQKPVKRDLEELLDLPVFIENHIRVRAIRQDIFQREQRPDVYLYYFMQVGISCCIMSDGAPFGGNRYMVGDIGHTIMDINGPQCVCGKKGCLQALAGEPALCKTAKNLLQKGRAELLKGMCSNPENPRIVEIAEAIDAGDEELRNALRPSIEYIGISIGNILNLLNCCMVIVDCAVFNSQVLQKDLRECVLKNSMFEEELNFNMEFVNSNRYLGAQGACALAIRKFLW